jgi:hypothetical protein
VRSFVTIDPHAGKGSFITPIRDDPISGYVISKSNGERVVPHNVANGVNNAVMMPIIIVRGRNITFIKSVRPVFTHAGRAGLHGLHPVKTFKHPPVFIKGGYKPPPIVIPFIRFIHDPDNKLKIFPKLKIPLIIFMRLHAVIRPEKRFNTFPQFKIVQGKIGYDKKFQPHSML